MQVIPSFIINSNDGNGMDVEFNGQTFHLQDGTSKVLNIVTKSGENIFKFIGNGTVSIKYRGGCL